MGTTTFIAMLDQQQLADLLKGEAKILRLTDDQEPLDLLLLVDPVTSGGPARLWNQSLSLVEANGVDG